MQENPSYDLLDLWNKLSPQSYSKIVLLKQASWRRFVTQCHTVREENQRSGMFVTFFRFLVQQDDVDNIGFYL